MQLFIKVKVVNGDSGGLKILLPCFKINCSTPGRIFITIINSFKPFTYTIHNCLVRRTPPRINFPVFKFIRTMMLANPL